MSLEIRELKKADEKIWDEYVYRSADSTFFHQIGWKRVVEKTYGHKPIYLVAEEDGEIKGVLPLFLMKSRIFGKKLVSVPFAPYGGVCADNERIKKSILQEAEEIAKKYKVDYMEFRNLTKMNGTRYDVATHYTTFIIQLTQDLNETWQSLRRDKKKGVKKAKKVGLDIEWGEEIDTFYTVYSKVMKELGTPAHRYSFFENIRKEFPKSFKILEIKHDKKTICCKFLLSFKDTLISMWGVTLKGYKRFHPYDLANWESIIYGHKFGYRYLDLGRCLVNSGVYNYKEGWSRQPKQLYYYYFYLKNKYRVTPDTSQSNPRRKTFAKIWKRLPLRLVQFLSPILRKNFP